MASPSEGIHVMKSPDHASGGEMFLQNIELECAVDAMQMDDVNLLEKGQRDSWHQISRMRDGGIEVTALHHVCVNNGSRGVERC